MKFTRFCMAACMAIACIAAHAHAFLDRAEPRVGSHVEAAPAEVKVWFSERLEGAFSTVGVTDASGKSVDRGDGRVDSGNTKLLRVSLPNLVPGVYTVHWRAVSADAHATQGDFVFHVGR